MKVVLDTNILIDLANGHQVARNFLLSLTQEASISTVSWMEVMVGAKTSQEKEKLTKLLLFFPVIETNATIAELTVEIRQKHRLHLPDAMILATARYLDACLLTRDTGYPLEALDIRVPYSL